MGWAYTGFGNRIICCYLPTANTFRQNFHAVVLAANGGKAYCPHTNSMARGLPGVFLFLTVIRFKQRNSAVAHLYAFFAVLYVIPKYLPIFALQQLFCPKRRYNC
jgi:hypothetical protein